MNEQQSYNYDVHEDSMSVNEPMSGYNVEINAIKHETLDTFMAFSDLDKVKKVNQYVLFVLNSQSQTEKEELSTIDKRIIDLQSKYEYESAGTMRPSDEMIAKALWFVQQCPNEKIFDKADLFPRTNGTILLQWELLHSTIVLNIGVREFSYAIVPTDNTDEEGNQASMTDSIAISEFYKKLLAS